MRISDWSSDVCSSDLVKWRDRAADLDHAIDEYRLRRVAAAAEMLCPRFARPDDAIRIDVMLLAPRRLPRHLVHVRSEEHTSELQSLMRISYAVFCLKKKNKTKHT